MTSFECNEIFIQSEANLKVKAEEKMKSYQKNKNQDKFDAG